MNNTIHEPDIFWGEIAPCEHLVQIYTDTGVFLDALEGFVGGGIKTEESVIVIATPTHRHALETRLKANGIDVAAAIAKDQLIMLDTADVLSQFMVNGWPDEALFTTTIMGIIRKARENGRRVRAFGEMVAVLWARGDQGATVRLEHLWHQLCRSEAFSLFCAYPRIGFTQDTHSSIAEICAVHSKTIPG